MPKLNLYTSHPTHPFLISTSLLSAHSCSKPSSFLLLNDPRSIEHGDSVLDSVDRIADDGEDDKEDDYYDGDDEVAFDHFCGAGGGWLLRGARCEWRIENGEFGVVVGGYGCSLLGRMMVSSLSVFPI